MYMNAQLVISILAVVILITMITIKRKKYKIISLISVVLVSSIMFGLLYVSNSDITKSFNLYFNNTKQHIYIIDNVANYIPLPSKTTILFRTSDTDAVYETKKTIDEIYGYYSKLSDKQIVKKEENNQTELEIVYNDDKITVLIVDEGRKRKMTFSNE